MGTGFVCGFGRPNKKSLPQRKWPLFDEVELLHFLLLLAPLFPAEISKRGKKCAEKLDIDFNQSQKE